jgi:hypothetical protein
MKPDLMTTALRCSFVFLLAFTLAGCKARGIDLPTAPVSGMVTYDGKPLGFGTITFFHPSGHAASANIAADGAFNMTAYQGMNHVAVECYEADRPGSAQARSRMVKDKSLIPNHYANYSTSDLIFEVKPGEKNQADFALKK